MEKTTFELINELIPSIASLLWPIFAFTLVIVFKKELGSILNRLKKGKILGNEIVLNEEIDKFEKSVKETVQEIPQNILNSVVDDEEIDILSSSKSDPKIGILILAREIEKELRELVGSLGLLEGKNHRNRHQSFLLLEKRGALPKHTMGSVKIFWNLRNEIVHGKHIENELNVIRILDIGMTLLNTLKSIPHETSVVFNPGVEIYSDKECTNKRNGVSGVILETTSPGGIERSHRIFPTTKPKYYEEGKKVAWEWDLSKIWDGSWYIDPDTSEKKEAWRSAGEFVGRHLDEI